MRWSFTRPRASQKASAGFRSTPSQVCFHYVYNIHIICFHYVYNIHIIVYRIYIYIYVFILIILNQDKKTFPASGSFLGEAEPMPLKKEKREECFSVVLKKFDFFGNIHPAGLGMSKNG